ncbi:NEL-type E3 ubiquitin ligase domain-containing protein [Pseudomonas entomophila]|uniref:NEL-type E3 ubiquitin ligase domain-containing protein n=1 Tax=Pseudomonas entomophila TaxID=312306 RepID=UPI0023D84624|nr:NEL-type E3 ubiquitin ligase domain-containing protein [Pseudomonas entomophila]MDF0729625.1 NEL-type E3 ubiquitin ligase domain-containing protein [Pseudomonas entomophila]
MQAHQPSSDQHATLAAAQSHQDHIIGTLLPGWLRGASPERLAALGEAMSLSLYFQQRVSEVLARLRGIDAFTEPLLHEALFARTAVRMDVRATRFRQGRHEPVVTSQPIGVPVTELVYEQTPLLEAALRNFSREQASQDGQFPGNRLLDGDGQQVCGITAVQFAACCRELDLGARYQQHLDSVLLPADTEARRTVHSLLARARRYAMLADAHVARLKGGLSEAELQLLVGVCGLRTSLTFEGRAVQPKRLKLLGCELEQIVVLDIRDDSLAPLYSSTHRVLVHVPGDPIAPWRACTSLRQFANTLGHALRTAEYQRFFSRFVRRRDGQGFFAQVISGYAGETDLANIDLGEHLLPWPGPLFDSLAAARIAQVKDDAAMIAVPVAALDLQLQREHDQRLRAEGWALLNLAGFFIPAVGVALLALSAWELLGEVYHGIEAWHEGDTSEALDHLFNVAGDIAAIAATVAGVSVARAAWARASAVDALVPATLESGATRLWNQDLAPYRSASLPVEASCDAQGVYRLGSQAWIKMEGHAYPVSPARDGTWRLQARAGLAPPLRHNGAGAWRLWSEQPLEWDDPDQLFRRLGMPFEQLDSRAVAQIMTAQNLDAAHLRAVHANGVAVDAHLLDAVERQLLDQRLRDMLWALAGSAQVDDQGLLAQARTLLGEALPDAALAAEGRARRAELFEHLYAAQHAEDGAEVAALRRQFPTLHSGAAAELLSTARVVDQQALRDTGRVPLRLAQAAREASGRIRVSRAIEGLYLVTAQGADLARLCLGLSARLPGAPTGIGWRLYEGSEQGPLLLALGEQGAGRFDLIHRDGRFTLRNAQGHTLSGPGELFETLAAAYDPAQRRAMLGFEPFADHLRAELGEQALALRAEAHALFDHAPPIGWFRPPQRLADGRVGYPLSGRGWRRRLARSLLVRLRELYPTYNDEQVDAWMREAGDGAAAQLARLERQREVLVQHLHEWSERPANLMQRLERRGFAEALRSCWQRRTNRVNEQPGQGMGYRLAVWGTTLSSLPELPETVSFAHVHELSLLSMGVDTMPSNFLSRFPRLRVLTLANNRFTCLPTGLSALPDLRELDLYDNEIRLDVEQASQLASCVSLEHVNLSFNPLGRAFPLHLLSNLRRLHLRATGISEVPPALFDRLNLIAADLRDNRITQLPERFYQAPTWLSRNVLLQGNPLDVGSAARYASYLEANELADGLADLPATANVRSRWLNGVQDSQRAERARHWDEVAGEEGGQDFFDMLARLLETVDFQQRPQVLGDRVFAMLQAMREHAGLREALFTQASLPLTCQDSVALAFSGLELRMLVWRAQADAEAGGQESALLYLGRQLWRLDEVERIARADVQARRAAGSDPDEIEVSLAYRLALRDALDLPAQPGDMAYGEVAGVGPERIARARTQVLAAQTAEQVAQSLLQREFWQEHLLRSHADQFELLDQPFHARLEALLEMAQTQPEGGCLSDMEALNRQRQAARQDLMRLLTLEALEADERRS